MPTDNIFIDLNLQHNVISMTDQYSCFDFKIALVDSTVHCTQLTQIILEDLRDRSGLIFHISFVVKFDLCWEVVRAQLVKHLLLTSEIRGLVYFVYRQPCIEETKIKKKDAWNGSNC